MRPTPLRPRTDNGGGRAAGSLTPQLPECAEDGDPSKGPPCTRPAHSPVPPTLYCPVGKSVARGLSRVLFGAAVGAKTPNSGGTEQHRSTIALAGSLRPKKASVEAHQAAGDQSTSYNFSSSHHSSVSLSQIDQKLLSGRSHLSSFSCALLPRMLPFLGCGSNETSILDLT